MYIVVSKWKVNPGKEGAFEASGRAVREVLRSQAECTLLEGFKTEDNCVVAIHGYASEDAYSRIVKDPNGPFMKAVQQHDLESAGSWVWSERGASME